MEITGKEEEEGKEQGKARDRGICLCVPKANETPVDRIAATMEVFRMFAKILTSNVVVAVPAESTEG